MFCGGLAKNDGWDVAGEDRKLAYRLLNNEREAALSVRVCQVVITRVDFL